MLNLHRVIHIADIHIRNYKRHEEYEIVFNRLYDYCRETVSKHKNTLIYVAGDIVHAKTDMSPELVEMTRNFLLNLSKIATTFFIAGNHDCNLNNKDRMDSLTPIFNTFNNNNNLFYFKETGVYPMGNVDFVVNSVFDTTKNFIKASDLEDNGRKKIVLYHGAINAAETDTGMKLHNTDVTIDLFEGFDYGFFGDIHRFQYLDSNKRFAYPGSLIQQNFGEDLKHGVIEWDLTKGTSKFVEIKNDFAYHTLEVEDGKIKDLPKEFSKNNYVRLRSINTSNSDIHKVITEIKSLANVLDVKVQRVGSSSDNNTSSQNKLGDIRDIAYQNTLITNYIKTNNLPADSKLLERIYEINRNVNKQVDDSDVVRNLVWTPNYFKFDNMFSYGEGNVVNFDSMNGVYGLFAPNASGKSSVLDAFMYCIFDKCSRTYRAIQVMNNKKENFKCTLSFNIGERNYFIERVATKDKKGAVKVVVNFWYLDGDNKVSLNGEDRDDTNRIIRKYLGTYDDFILTAMSVQGNNTNFVDKAQRERKDLLAQFLDLELFEELHTIANDDSKGVSTLIKEFSKQDYSTKILSAEAKRDEANTILFNLNSEKSDVIEKIEGFSNTIRENENKLIQIDSNLSPNSLQTLLEKEISIDRKIDETIRGMKSLEYELKGANESLDRYTLILSEFNKEDLLERRKMVDEIRLKLSKNESDLRNIKLQIQHCEDKVDNLKNHQYDPKCKFCVGNVFVQDAKKAESNLVGLNKDKNDLLAEIESLEKEFKKNSNVYTELDRLQKSENDQHFYQKTVFNLEKNIYSNKETLKGFEDDLVNVQNRIIKFKENEESIKTNSLLMEIIEDSKNSKSMFTKELKQVETKIIDYSGDIKVQERIINDCNESIQKLKELETEYLAYDYYLKCVNRNGIPYALIGDALPKIQAETNNILSQIVDFQVIFETDGKSINTYIVYDDDNFWPLELTSGMEKFISSIAIRAALINVCSLPRPNFIAIDEGLGTLDSGVLASFSMFLEYLKTQFDFIILISHIDVVRDMVDNQIEIKKENGFSKIEG